MPVIKDLVVDMAAFFDKWARAKGQYQPPPQPAAEFAVVPPATPQRREADAAIECIGCGVCYASSEVAARDQGYPGPAALNRALTRLNTGARAATDQPPPRVPVPAASPPSH